MAAALEIAEEDLPAVTVVVAFHKPQMAAAARQIGSLLAQTGVRLSIVAVLDGLETADDPALAGLLDRPGIAIIRHPKPLGVRGAFGSGLRLARSNAANGDSYFAYADQDDFWHPAKLCRCLRLLRSSGAQLVHCDARVVDERGGLIAPSLHRYETRREPRDLLGALLLNTVTGMTAAFTGDTARLTIALIDSYKGNLLHDHITAVAAASLGRVVLLDEALIDYVQHQGNQLGARLHYPWRSRALGAGHLAAYRRTSALMFEERRPLAIALEAHKLLPPALAAMFLAGPAPSYLRLLVCCESAIWHLLAQGQPRRAMLAMRMMDAAFTRRWSGDSIAGPR